MLENESEDDFEWEEVDVSQPSLEISLGPKPAAPSKTETKKKQNYHAERLRRLDCHKLHTICLLLSARLRNKWLNDPLLHARLLSLAPLALHNSFAMIHKSRVPEAAKRGRLFETALKNLADWWSGTFFDITSEGHIRNRTYDQVQKALESHNLLDDPSTVLDDETLEDILDEEGEVIRSEKSLMKHALMQSGSRDTSAQLFTALCRALGIPARLVVSLQSVPWQASVGKPKPKYTRKKKGKGKDKQQETDASATVEEIDDENDDDMEEVDISRSGYSSDFPGDGQRLDGSSPVMSEKVKGKQKAAEPIIKLRKTKSKGYLLGSASSTARSSPAPSQKFEPSDPLTTPPVYWTEVFSRPDGRWLPVDPIRGLVNNRKAFDPTPWTISGTSVNTLNQIVTSRKPAPSRAVKDNRMVYVVALEEDGYGRDVTRRYAREYAAKIAKVQGGKGAGSGNGRQEWWDSVVGTISRPYRLQRDDMEDEELNAAQWQEGMPTTISGFKNHPLYVLTRHLKQNETIHPPPPDTKELGKFRGEPVYPRSSVVTLKTAENWLRSEGRSIKPGQQALKFVKYRAGTVGRMRELAVLKDELKTAGDAAEGTTPSASNAEVMQGLYSRQQTEPFVPDPVVDGQVPKNNFGNIDLYVPSMLPEGAVHIPYKGTAKVARKLGLDYAEAVTGFEFKKRRAFPVVEGVVVAAENEGVLVEAYWEAEQQSEEKLRRKKEERAIKNWTQLIQGLRIRQRVQDQYVLSNQGAVIGEEENKVAHQKTLDDADRRPEELNPDSAANDSGGGFLVGADDVVQAYRMPKFQGVMLRPETNGTSSRDLSGFSEAKSDALSARGDQDDNGDEDEDLVTVPLETMDVDEAYEATNPDIALVFGLKTPKTMQELVEDAAKSLTRSAEKRKRGDEVQGPGVDPPDLVSEGDRLQANGNVRRIDASKNVAPVTRRRSSRFQGGLRNSYVERSDSEDDDEGINGKKPTVAPIVERTSTRTLRPRKSKS